MVVFRCSQCGRWLGSDQDEFSRPSESWRHHPGQLCPDCSLRMQQREQLANDEREATQGGFPLAWWVIGLMLALVLAVLWSR